MRMFCPRCGKKSRGLCIECFLENNPVRLKTVKLSLCGCGSFLYGGRWLRDIKESLKDAVERNLQVPTGIRYKKIRVHPEFRDDRIDLAIQVEGEYGGEEFTEDIQSKIKLSKALCPKCGKIRSGYYEAILQLRTEKKRPEIDVDPHYVSNVKKVKGGFDFYLTSAAYGRQLKKGFWEKGYSVRESSKLFGVKDGRKVYRMSISVKEPPFVEGDFIKHKKNILQIRKLGRKTLCRDVATKKEKMISISSLKDAKVLAHSSDLREGVVTMVSPKEIQILDLEDNETHELKNKGLGLEAGQEISILKLGKKIHVI